MTIANCVSTNDNYTHRHMPMGQPRYHQFYTYLTFFYKLTNTNSSTNQTRYKQDGFKSFKLDINRVFYCVTYTLSRSASRELIIKSLLRLDQKQSALIKSGSKFYSHAKNNNRKQRI